MFIFHKRFKPKSLSLREMFNIMRQWFYISTKCQADLCPFIQGHSFGLSHKYLNIFFSEITRLFKLKFHMEHSFDCFQPKSFL